MKSRSPPLEERPVRVCPSESTLEFTVIVVVPTSPSTVALIVALPGEMAVTIPVVDTVATLAALLDQLTSRPVSGVPVASRAPAVNC